MNTVKIRKNAKLLKQAFENAVEFVLVEQVSQIDDSFDATEPKAVSKAEAKALFEKWYDSAYVTAKYENDVLVSIKIKDCQYYFADSLTLVIVKKEEEQPTITAQDIADLKINNLAPKVVEITATPAPVEAVKAVQSVIVDGESFDIDCPVEREEIRFAAKMQKIAHNLDLIEKEVEAFEQAQEQQAQENDHFLTVHEFNAVVLNEAQTEVIQRPIPSTASVNSIKCDEIQKGDILSEFGFFATVESVEIVGSHLNRAIYQFKLSYVCGDLENFEYLSSKYKPDGLATIKGSIDRCFFKIEPDSIREICENG